MPHPTGPSAGDETPDGATTVVTVVASISDIDAAAWDACANPDPATYNPFLSHAFLLALEQSNSVAAETGWQPQHLTLADADGEIAACMPCYLKSHSRGEYVFDHAWADALQRAGGSYYPKLQSAVPFTPVPGARILARPGADRLANEQMMAAAAIELARKHDVSSLHLTFVDEAQSERLAALGLLHRTDQQFHWRNEGYDTFDAFLETLASRKRKAMRKERRAAVANGLAIKHYRGVEITEAHWDAFYEFYVDTGLRKWGRPYLNRAFFSLVGQTMSEDCLLVLAERDGVPIAGALNFIGGDCLYGRYWGAAEHIDCLHFEVCYYQAIDWAIAHGRARVEAGAQGEHKLARGYMPTTTHSVHWIADDGFRAAVDKYLRQERRQVARAQVLLADFAPFKKG